MKKIIISTLLSVAISASLLTGCASSQENPETKTAVVSEETSVLEETTEEDIESEEMTSEKDEERNELGLTESEMEIIYSDMEEAFKTEYLASNNLSEADFAFPEDFECWKYFAKSCMILMEEPDISEDRLQSLVSGMYSVSEEKQVIMNIAAKSFYNSVNKMDELIAIQNFQMSDIMIETAQQLLTTNIFADNE